MPPKGDVKQNPLHPAWAMVLGSRCELRSNCSLQYMVARNTCQHRTCAEIKRKIELAGSNEIMQSLFAALFLPFPPLLLVLMHPVESRAGFSKVIAVGILFPAPCVCDGAGVRAQRPLCTCPRCAGYCQQRQSCGTRPGVLLTAGRQHQAPRKHDFGGIPCLSVGKKFALSMASPRACWELISLCCWSGREWNELKGSKDFLMEIMWTCPIHAEPCVSVGEERFPVFHVSKCNSLRSNLVHSHQCQTGVRPLRPLSSSAGVGKQRVSLLGWKLF